MADSQLITLSLPDEQNEYQQLVLADAREAAERAGFRLSARFAESEAMTQIAQLFESIRAEGPDASRVIMMMPVHPVIARLVRAGARAGIAWAFLNRRPEGLADLRREFSEVPLLFVGPNQVEVGAIQGRQAQRLLPEGGSVLCVQGSATTVSAQDRLAGLRQVIEGSRVEVAGVVDGNWKEALAEKAVARWLRLMLPTGVKLDLVSCQADSMAAGARKALEAAAAELGEPRLAQVPITGCAGTPNEGQRYVREGWLAATVILPSSGGPAVDLLAEALAGKHPPEDTLLASHSHPAEDALSPAGD
jgi:ABC-type sugar transport system substrate-binding protein